MFPAGNLPGPSCSKRQLFVLLSVAKNLAFLAAEIRNEAVLRSE
jgi:hypothetical protein